MRRFLIDMDGVLADFVGGVCKLHGQPDPYLDPKNQGIFKIWAVWGITPKEFWTGCEHKFWANLKPYATARWLVDLLINRYGLDSICVLSSPSENKGCMPGKRKWLSKHFPELVDRFLFGTQKQFCASPDAVLIDDYDKNCDAFRAEGGKTFLVPRPWNSDARFEEFYLDRLISFLDSLD